MGVVAVLAAPMPLEFHFKGMFPQRYRGAKGDVGPAGKLLNLGESGVDPPCCHYLGKRERLQLLVPGSSELDWVTANVLESRWNAILMLAGAVCATLL